MRFPATSSGTPWGYFYRPRMPSRLQPLLGRKVIKHVLRAQCVPVAQQHALIPAERHVGPLDIPCGSGSRKHQRCLLGATDESSRPLMLMRRHVFPARAIPPPWLLSHGAHGQILAKRIGVVVRPGLPVRIDGLAMRQDDEGASVGRDRHPAAKRRLSHILPLLAEQERVAISIRKDPIQILRAYAGACEQKSRKSERNSWLHTVPS